MNDTSKAFDSNTKLNISTLQSISLGLKYVILDYKSIETQIDGWTKCLSVL